MAASLETIPTELLDIVTDSLHLINFCFLRLTSKRIYSASLHAFGYRFFSTITCDLSYKSLETLITVSQHEKYSQAVRCLNFETNYNKLQHAASLQHSNQHENTVPCSSERNLEAVIASKRFSNEPTKYSSVSKEHDRIVAMLTAAFNNLVHIKVIRYYHGKTADYTKTYKKSSEVDFTSRHFHTVLSALAISGLKLQKFKTVSKPYVHRFSKHSAVIPHDLFKLSDSLFVETQKAFSNLRSLELYTSAAYRGPSRSPDWVGGIVRFLSNIPSLESLRLQLDGICDSSRYTVDIIRSMSEAVAFPRLRKLHLRGTQFHEMDLVNFVLGHKETLRVIHFEYTRLRGGTWRSLLEVFRDFLELNVLFLLYPIQEEARITFPMEVFDNFWAQFIDVNDIDDDRDIRERLTEIIKFHEVGFERYAEYDNAYDSDLPSEDDPWWAYGDESEQSAPESEDEVDQG